MDFCRFADGRRSRAPSTPRLACMLLATSMLTATSALAQEAAPTPAPAPATPQAPTPPAATAAPSDAGRQLSEIVVTAQRREENIQNTPISVSAFNATTLKASGVSTVKDLVQVDPSLNVPQVVGVYLPFLRGIGNSVGGSIGNESSVPVYIDDVYYTRLSTAYLALGTVDRVEVLKGPQGTLFGRNSSGGAIQMFTRDPGQRPEVSGTLGGANYGTVSGQLYLSTPITDKLAWNIAVGGSDQSDGWGRSLTTGRDIFKESSATVRSKLVWNPVEGTRVKLVAFYAYSKGDIGLTSDRHSGTYGGTPAVPLPGYPNPPIAQPSLADVPGDHFYDTRENLPQLAQEEGYGASLRIDQSLGFADLVSITGFRNETGLIRLDVDLGAQDFQNADLPYTDRQVTQEVQLKSKPGSKISWIVGGFYMFSADEYDPAFAYGDLLTVAAAPGARQNVYSRQTIDSYSGFGQATAPLGFRTNLTLGLRYTNDEVTGTGRQSVVIPGLGELPLAPQFNDSKTFDKVTWKGVLDHHITDDVMVYGSVSRGYKSGTFTTLPLDGAPARPEVVDAYELGAKTEFLERRVRVDGALFWNEITNPQVLTVLNNGVTTGVALTNAQKARIRGGEIGVEAIAAHGLRLRGAATYLDAEYTEFTNAPFYSQNGTTITGPVLGDASGNRLPNAARWRFDLGANYTLDLDAGKVVTDVGVAYTGRFAWTPDNRVWEAPVTLLNASVSFTPSTRDWLTFSVWGKNLTGVEYYAVTQEATGPLGTGGFQSTPAAPRTFGGSVSFKF